MELEASIAPENELSPLPPEASVQIGRTFPVSKCSHSSSQETGSVCPSCSPQPWTQLVLFELPLHSPQEQQLLPLSS